MATTIRSMDHHSREHSSPSHIALTGHDFSPEEMQDLLLGPAAAPANATTNASSTTIQERSHHETVVDPVVSAESSISTSMSQEQQQQESTLTNVTSSQDLSSEAKAQARTERKRSREKQRRSDVNRQFSQLVQLIARIEAEENSMAVSALGNCVDSSAVTSSVSPDDDDDDDDERDSKKFGMCGSSGMPTSTMSYTNRADLIGRTMFWLNTLQSQSKQRKKQVADLQSQVEGAKKAGEETAAKLKEAMMTPQAIGNNQSLMMVPMMIPGSNPTVPGSVTTGAPTTANAPQAAQALPFMSPWMPSPYMGFQPQVQGPTPSPAAPPGTATLVKPPHSAGATPPATEQQQPQAPAVTMVQPQAQQTASPWGVMPQAAMPWGIMPPQAAVAAAMGMMQPSIVPAQAQSQQQQHMAILQQQQAQQQQQYPGMQPMMMMMPGASTSAYSAAPATAVPMTVMTAASTAQAPGTTASTNGKATTKTTTDYNTSSANIAHCA